MSSSVTLAAPLARPEHRITAKPDLEPGDVLYWGRVRGGATDDVSIAPDGSFSAEASVVSFDVWLEGGGPATQRLGSGRKFSWFVLFAWLKVARLIQRIYELLQGLPLERRATAKTIRAGRFARAAHQRD